MLIQNTRTERLRDEIIASMKEDDKLKQKSVLSNLISVYMRNTNISTVKGIEIGTQCGLTLSYILEHIPNLLMTAIDPQPIMVDFYANTKTCQDRITLIKLESDLAVSCFAHKEFDFVWIDGDHNYEQVKRDIINYLPFIKAYGFIGGHDYAGSGDVKKAVDEIFGDKITKGMDLTWWKYV